MNDALTAEEYLLRLLYLSGIKEQEINKNCLRKVSGRLVKKLGDYFREVNGKITQLHPLVVSKKRGGLAFHLEGSCQGSINFHGAQDKALYLFFWKHREDNLTSSGFLWAKEKDPKVRNSLLVIYKSIRGNGTDKHFLDLIDRIDEASLSQAISRINKSLKDKIDEEVLDQYTIAAGNNELRRVLLPAEFFQFRDATLAKAMVI